MIFVSFASNVVKIQ